MIDKKVLKGVQALLQVHGKLTCGVLAMKMQMPASSMVYFLRDALEAGVLAECNGFYDIPRPRPQAVQPPPAHGEVVPWCGFRKSLPWIEGNVIPSLVSEFATGVRTCETVYVVAEVSEEMCKEGVPHFTFAYIDIRPGKFIDLLSGWEITRHVLRYLVVDRAPAPAMVPVSVRIK